MSPTRGLSAEAERSVELVTPSPVLLPADCTIRGIAVLQSCLRSAPAAASLDGSAVRCIDAAGVKLLVAFMRARRAARHVDRWAAVSEVLAGTVLSLGLTTAVNLPGRA